MGADLVLYVLEMPIGEGPDWKAGEEQIESADLPALLGIPRDEEVVEDHREKLKDFLADLRDWWSGEHRRDVLKVDLAYTEAIVAGGMSWGDAPTDAFREISALEEAGVLRALGFVREKKTPEDDVVDLLEGAKRMLEEHVGDCPRIVRRLDSIIAALKLKSS